MELYQFPDHQVHVTDASPISLQGRRDEKFGCLSSKLHSTVINVLKKIA